MDINFLVPCKDMSGGLRVVAAYGNALLRRGHNVTVIYPRKQLHWKAAVKQRLVNSLVGETDHLDQFQGRLLAVPEMTADYIPRADCIIATAWETAEWANALPRLWGEKFYFIQGYETWTGDVERVHATYNFPMKKIVNSNWLKSIVEANCNDQNIPVIWNGKDFHLAESLGEGVHRKFDIGMIYSSVALKRSSYGIQAMFDVQRKFPDLRFIIFGSEKPQEPLPDNTTVIIKPSQAEIRRIYLSTRIWTSPSLREGFCLPALEAISLGSVVVATNSLGIQDIITDGIDGYLVEPESSTALAEKFEQVLKNEQLYKKLQHAGLMKSERFSWVKSAEKFEKYLLENMSEVVNSKLDTLVA